MYLLEHDAKELLDRHAVPVPPGRLIGSDDTIHRASLPPGPWIIKGQISAGGRGKAGIIRKAATLHEIADRACVIFGTAVKGRRVNAIRIEQQVTAAKEAYLGFLIDPVAAGVRVIMSARGGMGIEALPPALVKTDTAPPEHAALAACMKRLTAAMPDVISRALGDAGERLARIFLECEALLIEINPLFVKADGSWIAGDAKFVTDDNALVRQPEIRDLLERRAAAYPEVALKLKHGCDYVVVDPDGDIGLLTTGAGLSMMLIDELRAAGLKPYNFLDVRTGGLRGETARLVNVLNWVADGPRVRVLLVNIFAGITDLGEFSQLLVTALREAPRFNVPVVARLVGNGLPAAREVLSRAGIKLYTELDDALAEVRRHLSKNDSVKSK